MAKNTIITPIKDGVKADNSTYSSNQIERFLTAMDDKIDESIAAITEKLNYMRPIFEINVDYNAGTPTMDKTYPEIKKAYDNNALIIINTKLGGNYTAISSLCDYIQENSGFITAATETIRSNPSTSKLSYVQTIINASEYYTAPTVNLIDIE